MSDQNAASSSSSWASWGTSLYSNFVQQLTTDLQEFVDTVKEDSRKQTTEVASEIQTIAQELRENTVDPIATRIKASGSSGVGGGVGGSHGVGDSKQHSTSDSSTSSGGGGNGGFKVNVGDTQGEDATGQEWFGAVGRGWSSLMSSVQSSSPTKAANSGGGGGWQSYNRKNAVLSELYSNPETFTKEPADSANYQEFCRAFKLSEHTEEISRLLSSDAELREVQSKVVPSQIAHDTFWLRYFYYVNEVAIQESHRKEMIEAGLLDDNVEWDNDDDDEQAKQEIKQETKQEIKQEIKQDTHSDIKQEDLQEPQTPPAKAAPMSDGSPKIKSDGSQSDDSFDLLDDDAGPSDKSAAVTATFGDDDDDDFSWD